MEGVGEVAVAAAVDRTAIAEDGFVASVRVLEDLETTLGSASRIERYALLVAMAGPGVAGLRLLEGRGNFGDADNPPADPLYTECRLTDIGRLVVRDGAGTVPGLPIELINGDMTRGGERPPFDPGRVLDAALWLIDDPGLSEAQVAAVIGAPVFPTGCTVEGRIDGLLRGEPVDLLLAAQTQVVDAPRGRVLVVTGLTPQITPSQVQTDLIVRFYRRSIPGRPATHVEASFRDTRDVGDVADVSSLRVEAVFAESADEADVMARITSVDGLVESRRAHLLRPAAATLRDWIAALGPQHARANIDKARGR